MQTAARLGATEDSDIKDIAKDCCEGVQDALLDCSKIPDVENIDTRFLQIATISKSRTMGRPQRLSIWGCKVRAGRAAVWRTSGLKCNKKKYFRHFEQSFKLEGLAISKLLERSPQGSKVDRKHHLAFKRRILDTTLMQSAPK